MSDKRLYVEGGGESKELQTRCREAFSKLLTEAGFEGRLPRIIASGSRNAAYEDFTTAHTSSNSAYVGLLVDSEDPVSDGEAPWEHLRRRDGWERPKEADDTQVFLMTTCMETWIVADRTALQNHYSKCLQTSALPATTDLEARDRHTIQDALVHATRTCSNAYTKNKRSFVLLGSVRPSELQTRLPAFARMIRILDGKL